ncbi:T9SS type A sorting domain-containing protein [uncultured Dokdonia sp.]|uniref:T9SS type A sorting domain-containing protein n=1 Tax=uncultured Dokdonia sp. TaxID=575653 RepID=UPI002633D7FC|nr:T9SS type A sorting domain-containing protein [uncultured Dokdonia sp.]
MKRLLLLVLTFITLTSQAQDIPFNCDYNAYLFQYNDVYAIDLASGNSYLAAENVTEGNINATAHNGTDGFIWGSLSTPSKTIVRIGKNFTTTTFYVPELPTSNRYIGDISLDGVYYLKSGGTTYYKIDVHPESENYGKYIATESLSQGISIHDWAFNAVDGLLYAVERNTNILYRIDPSNGAVQSLGEVPILSGLDYTYGAVYFDTSGRFYVSANQTGAIYVIHSVQNLDGNIEIDSNLFAFGPSSSSNDGARCCTAPVLQEICDNGIDDDGDGLIDCEDPSCSGYGYCEVIEAPSSSANNGGLESNNRLSDVINQRSYNRAKTNYTFNKETAARVEKTSNYAHRNADASIQLEDFIPLEIIDESYVVASTPEDLITITNATEVYAVDYIKEDISVASILALKTEDGVYEHTKYICDRLLGGELISVSTIDINEQPFIKSLIKNPDGTVEFVLSLSAKAITGDTEFAVESHWNLDQYEEDVTYYNFQIWSNSIDDLYLLGTEVLNLLNIEKPITEYDNSTPPTVFVRKGAYVNGGLDLEIINTNQTEEIAFDAGIRTTETSEVVTMASTIDLQGDYITNVTIETGNLFDIGFRIGDGIATPDDLFMSDGPWGIDDSQEGTTVQDYIVNPNTETFDIDLFPIERNVHVEATTSSYVATYRALTPRFQAVDVSEYTSFTLEARGTGDLEITFVKQSIDAWEDQYKQTITLTDELQEFMVPVEAADLTDVVTIVFTMVSESGSLETKEMDIQQLRFSNESVLAVDAFETESTTLRNYPNPFTSSTTIQLPQMASNIKIEVYDMLGSLVDQKDIQPHSSNQAISYSAPQLVTGMYVYRITDDQQHTYTGRFMIK